MLAILFNLLLPIFEKVQLSCQQHYAGQQKLTNFLVPKQGGYSLQILDRGLYN